VGRGQLNRALTLVGVVGEVTLSLSVCCFPFSFPPSFSFPGDFSIWSLALFLFSISCDADVFDVPHP
jgi:hypothetical protein